MSVREKAASGVKWTATSSILTTCLKFGQLAVLARLLRPEDFGLMAMIMVVIGFVQAYGDMGISQAIVYKQDTSREQLSSLYWLNILAGVIVFVGVAVTAPFVVLIYSEPRIVNLLLLTAVALLIMPFGQQFQMLMQRELQFSRLAFIEIAATVAGVMTAIMLALGGQGVTSLIWGQLVNTAAMTALLVKVGLKEWRPLLHFHRNDLKGYIRFGVYQMGERSVNYIGWNMDKLLIGSLLGAQALGYYHVAYQLMVKPFQVFNPIITRVAFPVFAKFQTDNRRLRGGFLEAIRVIAVVLFPIYMGMIVLAEPFVLLFLGADWMPTVHVFQILAVLGFFYSLGNPLGSLLLAKGRADIAFYLNLLMILLYGGAIWVGSRFGVEGIATGLVMATSVVLFPMGFWIRWILVRMQPMEYIRAFIPSLLVALIMAGVIHYLGLLIQFSSHNFVNLVIWVGVGAFVYIPLVYFSQRETFVRLWKTFH
jgi:lipopolysaccharide exporter